MAGGAGDVDWYRQEWRADGTGSGSAPTCSGPCTGRSHVQEFHQPPYAPPSPGHIVLIGMGPPTSAGGGPHSYTELSNSQDPCGYYSPQDPACADWGLVGELCFLCKISLPVKVLSLHFHSHSLHHCLGNQHRLAGCNSPWFHLVLQLEACSWDLPVNEPHSLIWLAPGLGLDVDQGLGVGAEGGDDAGVAGRSPGGTIHGVPAGSRVGCYGNHRCAHGRTA